MGEPERGIRQVVERLDRAWQAGDFDVVAELFHPDAVMATPDFGDRLVGRDACVDSYRGFTANATVHHFAIGTIDVDIVGESAVATYPYETVYEIETGTWKGTGRDLLVLRREGDMWRIVWRCLTPGPEAAV